MDLYIRKVVILYIDQHVDKESGELFMRLESEFSENTLTIPDCKRKFDSVLTKKYQIKWSIHTPKIKPKMALLVSKNNHFLYDILSRFNSGELVVEIPFIISNHKDLKYVAKQFQIPFYHVPVSKSTKAEAEKKQLELLKVYKIYFVVFARYMQIITSKIIDQYPHKTINIHHSFLLAFAGEKPYHVAFKRGVKIIGATGHYVTEELDAGPIIEQDTTIVSHTHITEDFIAKGRDLEKIVFVYPFNVHCL